MLHLLKGSFHLQNVVTCKYNSRMANFRARDQARKQDQGRTLGPPPKKKILQFRIKSRSRKTYEK